MSVIARGIKNTFRNTLRTIGFSVIIAVSLGLAFSMALAHQTVKANDKKIRENIGASLLVLPLGSAEGTATLSDSDTDKLAKLPNVSQVVKITTMAVQHPDEAAVNEKIKKENDEKNKNSFPVSSENATSLPKTNLHSTISQDQLKTDPQGAFKPSIPAIIVEGTTTNIDSRGNKIVAVEGQSLNPHKPDDIMIGKALATKNKLSTGDTLTIAGKTLKIAGIFDTGTSTGDNRILAPFETVRTLKGDKHQVPVVVLVATSLEVLAKLKSDTLATLHNQVDIQVLQQDAAQVAAGLESVASISLITLVVALAAGALTILLTMLLVVRERTKEIGVLKALGATNTKIVAQFMIESTVLTLIGAAIGLVFAVLASNSILGALLSNNIKQTSSNNPGGASTVYEQPIEMARQMTEQITTYLDWHSIIYGLLATLGIALIATILPAFLIAKVRPAQIMRGDS
ncbi:MAG TPA: FtsX-like permease family protein [Candidatus Saccharimonadales bacterium]|nr:FtsX-like permease family protein [Candidatus Saccharimonadales bacterium]